MVEHKQNLLILDLGVDVRSPVRLIRKAGLLVPTAAGGKACGIPIVCRLNNALSNTETR